MSIINGIPNAVICGVCGNAMVRWHGEVTFRCVNCNNEIIDTPHMNRRTIIEEGPEALFRRDGECMTKEVIE